MFLVANEVRQARKLNRIFFLCPLPSKQYFSHLVLDRLFPNLVIQIAAHSIEDENTTTKTQGEEGDIQSGDGMFGLWGGAMSRISNPWLPLKAKQYLRCGSAASGGGPQQHLCKVSHHSDNAPKVGLQTIPKAHQIGYHWAQIRKNLFPQFSQSTRQVLAAQVVSPKSVGCIAAVQTMQCDIIAILYYNCFDLMS